MPRKRKTDTTKRHYRIVLFYPRAHQPTFQSKLEAERYIEARALTKHGACYTELWDMTNDEDGIQLAVFEYGNTKPQKLVRE